MLTDTNTGASVRIAPIQLADIDSFHACLDQVAREARFLAFTEAPCREQTLRFIAENLKQGHVQLVARDGDRVIGWCDIIPGWQPGLQHCGVLGMGLLPTYRGQGLGRRLLSEALTQAHDQGLHRIELEARSDNLAALALYRKLGFADEGRKRDGLYLDGDYHDTTQMGLLLSPAQSSG